LKKTTERKEGEKRGKRWILMRVSGKQSMNRRHMVTAKRGEEKKKNCEVRVLP